MNSFKIFARRAAVSGIVILSAFIEILSQGTDSKAVFRKEGKLYIGFAAEPRMTSILNKGFRAISDITYQRGTTINFTVEAGYYFSRYVGITFGAGTGSYRANLSLDSTYNAHPWIDPDQESCEMRVRGKSVSEEQKISFLRFPVCLNLKFPAGEKLTWFLKGGLSLNLALDKSYKGDGTFSYSGFYSAYPVLLENIAGIYPSNQLTSSSGSLEVKSFSQAVLIEGGSLYKVNESIYLALAFQFMTSIGNLSTYKADPSYTISPSSLVMRSIMGGASSVSVGSFGISLGLRYYFR
jgi:hypothetical protein